jgi:adenine deaminase
MAISSTSLSSVSGNIVDLIQDRIFPGILHIENGRITQTIETPGKSYETYILPGFIDAHIHIESSMLIPSEFARAAVAHGMVATVSDPHEIANVLGEAGVSYMIDNGAKTPFKFYFGAPSCVPATGFETAGATLDPDDIERLLSRPEIVYLSEMMNYPGVINKHPDVMAKIEIAHRLNKPIDGHAPGLRGEALRQYVSAGISTDHECFTLPEALEKISLGMKIIIREGSAARNFAALHTLIGTHPTQCMFCSDDRHPDALQRGTINDIVREAVSLGYPLLDVLKIASLNPITHYGLDVGLLQHDDPADFIIVKSLKTFEISETFIDGERVFSDGITHIQRVAAETPNNFSAHTIDINQLQVPSHTDTVRTIDVRDGQLITESGWGKAIRHKGSLQSNTDTDVLKIVVVNRYHDAAPAIGFVRHFGLKHGAIASSVAHDSHNIVAVGVSDAAITSAINALIAQHGGLSVIDQDQTEHLLALPVAGLMSVDPIEIVAETYSHLDTLAKSLGSPLEAPFMTLSFLALLVIPKLKLSDKGLFDGETFQFVSLTETTPPTGF